MTPVLERIHHVAYVARDRAEGIAVLSEPYGLEVTREFELPQFSVRAAFLSGGSATVEVVEYTDPGLTERRLDGLDVRLDHVAYEVADIERAAQRLRELGVRLCAPDESPLEQPLEVVGNLHLWTVPVGAPGICLQLVQPGAS